MNSRAQSQQKTKMVSARTRNQGNTEKRKKRISTAAGPKRKKVKTASFRSCLHSRPGPLPLLFPPTMGTLFGPVCTPAAPLGLSFPIRSTPLPSPGRVHAHAHTLPWSPDTRLPTTSTHRPSHAPCSSSPLSHILAPARACVPPPRPRALPPTIVPRYAPYRSSAASPACPPSREGTQNPRSVPPPASPTWTPRAPPGSVCTISTQRALPRECPLPTLRGKPTGPGPAPEHRIRETAGAAPLWEAVARAYVAGVGVGVECSGRARILCAARSAKLLARRSCGPVRSNSSSRQLCVLQNGKWKGKWTRGGRSRADLPSPDSARDRSGAGPVRSQIR
ncbi:hypothetical protein BC834DRAFT_46370 [Gloeopeniophorella convolvens]|nr:hypothetical protein BC834DRAFT_46370 [Gloeopeniophorella convolvens]